MLAVATTLVFWASAFVAIRHLGGHIGPGALSLGRLAVGSLCLGAVLLSRGWTRPRRGDWLPLALIGVLWFGLYNVALNEGERRVDAGTAAMLIQVAPVLIAVLAVLFLRERSSVFLWIGLVVAFAGVAVISLSTSPGGDRDVLGVVLCLVSAAAYSISVILQKPLLAHMSALQVTWIACTVGVVVCLPFAGELWQDASSASAADLGWIVYLGAFPTAIAFTTYAYALTHMDASSLGVTTYLVPPITVLMAWVLLSEVPPVLTYAGGALCLVGVALARHRPRRAATPTQSAEPAAPSATAGRRKATG
ncbi:DMT family transporter [Nocardioides mesophilus]|uniref:DMT family transporter n=1 Tax=Nocardioides mesophilus TaxID=433659 RepID=A0A7G9RGY7_9ACTN|nr:DMT family transporter [Nocardioides mesophilus]